MMRLSTACLSLAFLAPSVLANELSGPYQSLLLWYAYRLDIAAGGSFIAPYCPGSGADGTCYFDEFLRYIQAEGYTWSGSTSVGKNLDPNVVSTAEELSNSGYSNLVNPENLYDSHTGYRDFVGLFQPAIDNIQQNRLKLGDKGIDSELSGVRESLVHTLDARRADQAQKIIDGVNDQLKQAGYTWTAETKSVPALDGTTWEEVDTEKTISLHDDAYQGLGDAIDNYISNFANVPSANNNNKKHARFIWACTKWENRVFGDPSC